MTARIGSAKEAADSVAGLRNDSQKGKGRGKGKEFSGGLEEVVGFAEEDFRAAGFVEHAEGAVHAGGVLLDFDGVAGVGGEHEELAVGQLALKCFSELQARLVGHGDIAEEEAGIEGASAGKTFGGGVDSFRLVPVGLEDEVKSIGDQTIVIDYENTLFHEVPRPRLLEEKLVAGVKESCTWWEDSLRNLHMRLDPFPRKKLQNSPIFANYFYFSFREG
jgi:hypothetical protein